MQESPKHEFEWKHTREDQVEFTVFSMRYMQRGSFYAGQRRRSTAMLVVVCCLPLAVVFGFSFDEQTPASWIGIGMFLSMMLYFVFRKQTAPELDRLARKNATRYVDSLDEIPLGTHRMEIDGDLLRWSWVDGRARHEYPMSAIKSIESHDGRVYVIRAANFIDGMPFSAFGDQATREATVTWIQARMNDDAPS